MGRRLGSPIAFRLPEDLQAALSEAERTFLHDLHPVDHAATAIVKRVFNAIAEFLSAD